ncbi:MAG: hypothetical protein P8047_03415 [Gammaproteobacteria bacterium]
MSHSIRAALHVSLFMTLMLFATFTQAADKKTVTTMDTRIQDLKKQVLDLNRDLFLLEQDLLFPANTQFSVFVSMDSGMTFNLDSVQKRGTTLKIIKGPAAQFVELKISDSQSKLQPEFKAKVWKAE